MKWVKILLRGSQLKSIFKLLCVDFNCFCAYISLSTEFNPVQQPLLNEKVLRDKRKKLRETFDRIVRLYERENPETYKELRKLELDYETKRGQLALYFDSVKVCHFSACLHYKSVFDDGMQYLITNNLILRAPRMRSLSKWTASLYQTCLMPLPTSTFKTSHSQGLSRPPF